MPEIPFNYTPNRKEAIKEKLWVCLNQIPRSLGGESVYRVAEFLLRGKNHDSDDSIPGNMTT